MKEAATVTRAAGMVGGATLFSRILGFVRDAVIAGFFGAGPATDAFFVAFRMPNLLRRLFAEGTVSMALVPVLTDEMRRRGRGEALRLAQSALQIGAMALAALTVLGLVGAPVLVTVLAPGFARSPEIFGLAVDLARIMMPFVLCIGLVAVAMGVLNTLGHFAAPALAPACLNLAMIGAVLATASWMAAPIRGLAWGVVAGGLFQLALQVPFLVRAGLRFFPPVWPLPAGIGRIGRLLGPATFGAAIYQINLMVATLLASLLPPGAISFLYYADRLVQFPLGIFAVALATAVMPSLSRRAADRDLAGLRDTTIRSLGLVLFLTVPAMAGLMALGQPLVALLFQRGAFDAESARLTASALVYYSTGLWASAALRIVLAASYALEDAVTPVRAGLVAVGGNLALGWVLMGPLGFRGLALASALAAVGNLGLICVALDRRLGGLQWRVLGVSAAKTVICAAVMGVVVRLLMAHPALADAASFAHRLAAVAAGVAAGVLVYGLLAWWIGCPELAAARRMLTRKGSGT